MSKNERLMLAAWIAYKAGMCQFPADYMRDHCNTTYAIVRRPLPDNIQYLAETANELAENPPKLYSP